MFKLRETYLIVKNIPVPTNAIIIGGPQTKSSRTPRKFIIAVIINLLSNFFRIKKLFNDYDEKIIKVIINIFLWRYLL